MSLSARSIASVLALVFAWLLGTPAVHEAVQPKLTMIGMSKTFFTDQPKDQVEVAVDDFRMVLKKTTGLDGSLKIMFTPEEIAAKLESKEYQFGIFFAHEYGWLQKKHPELKPLLVAIKKDHDERVYVIVHQKDTAKSLVDLQGKKIDIPVGTIEPSRLVLERLSMELAKKTPMALFAGIEKSSAQVTALDNVARGTVDAALVDANFLKIYKDTKGPVFEKNLRVLHESVVFPPAVIVYKPGAVDPAIVTQFRDGLLKAHMTPQGLDLMKTWKIDLLELPPANYDQRVAEIVKTYPAQ